MRTISLYGFDFHSANNNDQVLSFLRNWELEEGKLPILITPNVDQIVKFSREENAVLKSQLQKAAIILPDGQPIVWTSKMKNGSESLKSRLTGSDLFPELWNQLKDDAQKVFFILPNEELGEVFKKEYQSCEYFAPPYFSIENKSEFASVLKTCTSEIRSFNPDHVFIGLGFPKQEHLALAIHEELANQRTFYHLLGASFEFYQGKKKRAPQWMQNMGLEFLHRMLSEPGRMVKRYLVDDMAFLPLLIRELRRP
jgi:N-acetylglucosaminyldiphosphoundecaprenol N-acetyl-beta-D-mannosaminyltransferase